MASIFKTLPSYIKDSQHALQIFRDFYFLGQDKLIFTMDITSLYTVIPNGEGLLAIKHFFDQRTVKEPKSETLLRLAELVFTLNCFSFGDNFSNKPMAYQFRRFCRTPIFQPIQRTQTSTLRSLHWRLYRRYHLYQRGVNSIHNRSQFFSPGSKIYLGNFRRFFILFRHQSFNWRQRFMH